MSVPRNRKNDSVIAGRISTLMLEQGSSTTNIEESTMYGNLEDNLRSMAYKLRQISEILEIPKVDKYVKALEKGEQVIFNPTIKMKEPITREEYLPFLTGYDDTTQIQTYYSNQNVWFMNKYSIKQLEALIKSGAEIEYKGKLYNQESKNLDKLVYEYNIDLNNPVYGWLYTVYENLSDILKGNKEAIERIIKTKRIDGKKYYINAGMLKYRPDQFLTKYGTSVADMYEQGGHNDMYINTQHCMDILDKVLGNENYTMIVTPAMNIHFPKNFNQTEAGAWKYDLKQKLKDVLVNKDGQMKKKPITNVQVEEKTKEKQEEEEWKTIQKLFTYDEVKVIRGFYLDVLGNFKIGQLVTSPSFVATKATSTAEEFLKKNLMKSVWPVFRSIPVGDKYTKFKNIQDALIGLIGEKFKDINVVTVKSTIPLEQLIEDTEIRKRLGVGEGDLRVNMIEGKRDDVEHVKVPEIRPEPEKKEEEDLQEVQTTIPIQQQEEQTNGEQPTQTQVENELEDIFDAL